MQLDRHRYGYGDYERSRTLEFHRYSLKELLLMQSKGKSREFTPKEKKQVADYEKEQRLKNQRKRN